MEMSDCAVCVDGAEGRGCKNQALLGPFSLSSLSLLLACNWAQEVVIKTGWLVKY